MGSTDNDVARVVCASIGRCVAQVLAHDPGVRSGEGVEHVHQLRVATRRLRSDLRTFHRLLEPEAAVALREELGWLGGLVGAVRDLDVLDEHLREACEHLPERDRAAARLLLSHLATQHAHARATLLGAMASPRYEALLERLIAFAAAPPLAAVALDPGSRRDQRAIARRAARRPWKHLRRAVRALPADPADHELHHVRIVAKRARYAAETVAELAGRPAERFATAVARVQAVFGEHQDTVVAEEWLRATATAIPACAVVAGELVERERARRAVLRRRWPDAWARVDRRSLRRWMQG